MNGPQALVLSGAVEGIIDEAILRRLAAHVGLGVGPVHGKNGKDGLLEKLGGFNQAARFAPWVVLVDLNAGADCAPAYAELVLPDPSDGMNLRIAVRQAEAWLMADLSGLSQFLRIRQAELPGDPDGEPNAKIRLVNAARNSRNNRVVADMVPREKSGRKTGPAYAARVIEFVARHWDIDSASQHSDSLARCVHRLRNLATPY